MSDIKVTQAEIDLLLNSADVQVRTEFGKCTVATVRLRNGFILTESSACVDPANYDAELGKRLCLQHIENRLWELEGYALQKRTDEERTMECAAADTETRDFGWALSKLRCGWPVRRRGWNGKGIFIKLQVPDEHSKMTSPYILHRHHRPAQQQSGCTAQLRAVAGKPDGHAGGGLGDRGGAAWII